MKTLRLAVILALLSCFSTLGFAQVNCAEVQKKFNEIRDDRLWASSWTFVREVFGNPTKTTFDNDRISSFIYVFDGCQTTFYINSHGNISAKSFELGSFPTSASQNVAAELASPNRQSEVAETLKGLQSTLQQLRSDIAKLERVLQDQKLSAGTPGPAANYSVRIDHLATRSPFKTAIPTTSHSTPASTTTISDPPPTPSTTTVNPAVAENGSYYGQISEATGRPKTVPVRGYYRKDGTYVKPHYRSAPRRKN